MKSKVTITFLVALGLTETVEAANFAMIATPPAVLNLAVLLLAFTGVVIGIQLLNVIKGGFLGRAWQIFVVGFGVLALAQLTILLETVEIISIPVWITPTLMVVWAGIFIFGLFQTKRILT